MFKSIFKASREYVSINLKINVEDNFYRAMFWNEYV